MIAAVRAAGENTGPDSERSQDTGNPSLAPSHPASSSSAPAASSENPLAVLGISLAEVPRREGPLLVLSPGSVLPDRCVKCNAPAYGQRLLVTLRHSPTGANAISLILFLIIPVLWLQSYQAEVEVGICPKHLYRVRKNRALGRAACWRVWRCWWLALRSGPTTGTYSQRGLSAQLSRRSECVCRAAR